MDEFEQYWAALVYTQLVPDSAWLKELHREHWEECRQEPVWTDGTWIP